MDDGSKRIVIALAIGGALVVLIFLAIFFLGRSSSEDVDSDNATDSVEAANDATTVPTEEEWRNDLAQNPEATLKAIVANPLVSWEDKNEIFEVFIERVAPTAAECQQLPPGDSNFLAKIQKGIDEGRFSEGMQAYLEALLDIARRYGIDDNEWDDDPPAITEALWLKLEYKAIHKPNDEGTEVCLYPEVDIEVDYRPGDNTAPATSEVLVRNSQRRNDIGAIRGQLVTVLNNNNLVFPDNADFDRNVLEQFGQSIYRDEDSEAVIPLLADKTSAGKIYYIDEDRRLNAVAINADNIDAEIVKVVVPAPDELHILIGFRCGRDSLTNGNQQAGDANPYATGDLEIANLRAIAFVYQLEGEATARCDDNV